MGAIGAIAGLSVPLDGCETSDVYGPLFRQDSPACCEEFNTTAYEQYYNRCLKIAAKKDCEVYDCSCSAIQEETRQSVEQP